MNVVQSLNQNALLVNDAGKECIVVGKGIGFGKKKGDKVSEDLITKVYKMAPEKSEWTGYYENVDEQCIQMAEEIAEQAEKFLNKEFSGNFILSLASHIQYLEAKYQDQIDIPEPFHYELKYLFSNEHQAAEWSIKFLQDKYNLNLPMAEVSFFTLHFVNGLLETGQVNNVVELSNILNETIELLEGEMNRDLNRETIEFSRFVVHLRYFIIRNLTGKLKDSNIEEEAFKKIYDLSFEMFPFEKAILEKLKTMLYLEHDMKFGNSEDFYLLLHLVRIMKSGGGCNNEFSRVVQGRVD
ncbi:BglG family transcriptional antiterminator [Trichococcus patagoniensis]|uniref:BglG family transcriptional antiterminator n=1 Tax=Trichococcus patagoniensis TaxID=382641 RepID=A0A2T5IK47_9LACT|nr:PRD domain-containing protein [Trichococcus patagoniensis]PTQ84187.1 BglG family transcriptional antiterminator [Trichococcus patagoniensis]